MGDHLVSDPGKPAASVAVALALFLAAIGGSGCIGATSRKDSASAARGVRPQAVSFDDAVGRLDAMVAKAMPDAADAGPIVTGPIVTGPIVTGPIVTVRFDPIDGGESVAFGRRGLSEEIRAELNRRSLGRVRYVDRSALPGYVDRSALAGGVDRSGTPVASEGGKAAESDRVTAVICGRVVEPASEGRPVWVTFRVMAAGQVEPLAEESLAILAP